MSHEDKIYLVSSGYGSNTRKPYVEVEAPDLKVQMSPGDARNLALNLLQASESALSDAFLVTFVMEQIQGELNEAAGLLQEFREWRDSNTDVFRNGKE